MSRNMYVGIILYIYFGHYLVTIFPYPFLLFMCTLTVSNSTKNLWIIFLNIILMYGYSFYDIIKVLELLKKKKS